MYMHTFILHHIGKVEGSRFYFLENYIATACASAFSYFSVPHACCWWFIWKAFDVFVCVFCVDNNSCCVCSLAYLFHTHDICSCSFCLLFVVLNDIYHARNCENISLGIFIETIRNSI